LSDSRRSSFLGPVNGSTSGVCSPEEGMPVNPWRDVKIF
jgi:hypothetical protein